jgi:hypothetical protein
MVIVHNVKLGFMLIKDVVHLVPDCVLNAAMLIFAPNVDKETHNLIVTTNANANLGIN